MTQEWRTRETDPLKRIVAELGELRGTLTSITNGILTNAGLVVAKGLLRVIQSMRVEGNLDVTGTLTTSGDTTLGGDVDVTGDLDVTGTTELGGPTTISGDTDVTGTFGVTGTTTLGGPTTISGNTGVSGSLNVTGPMTVGGTLSLPAGIIDNDALTSPVEFAEDASNADGFTLTQTVDATITQFAIPVPAGYTRAIVTAFGMIFVYNGTATFTYLRSRVFVEYGAGSWWSRRLIERLPDGSSAAMTVNKQQSLTGLDGGDITVRLTAYSDFVDVTHASNGATVNAMVTFLR